VRTIVTEDGQPVVQFSNYEAFVYHESMKSWLRIADNKFTGSEHNTLISRIGNEDQRPLSLLRQLQEVCIAELSNSKSASFKNVF